jgi:thiol-disulfide isomerase/thioredoxin
MTQKNWRKRAVVGLILAAVALPIPMQLLSTAAEPQRNAQQVVLEINQGGAALREALVDRANLSNATKRAEVAPRAIPVMKRQVALLEELVKIEPAAAEEAAPERMQFLAMLSVLGDKEATETLAKQGKGANAADAASAKGHQLLVRWWAGDGEAAKQGKVIDDLSALAKQYPKEDVLARLAMMLAQERPATKELAMRAQDVILNDLKGEVAVAAAEMIASERKMAALMDKPLVIKGTTADGKAFSSEQYKGKVVLVDFWATWCGPCMEELPRVKKVYQQFNPKGLEIVGVSCDRSKAALENQLAKDGEMTWVQLFDEQAKGWHPLASEYGVSGIPTMFLIDRKGVVRSVDAGMELEQLVGKLIAEE